MLVLFLMLSFSLFAGEIAGRVVCIADGDTLTILDATGTTGVSPVANTTPLGQRASCPLPASPTQHKIRLYGIDAPESHQAFGQKSKQHLSSLVFGEDVRDLEANRKQKKGKQNELFSSSKQS
jgi:endonuclease YncB( thermonuclease family)